MFFIALIPRASSLDVLVLLLGPNRSNLSSQLLKNFEFLTMNIPVPQDRPPNSMAGRSFCCVVFCFLFVLLLPGWADAIFFTRQGFVSGPIRWVNNQTFFYLIKMNSPFGCSNSVVDLWMDTNKFAQRFWFRFVFGFGFRCWAVSHLNHELCCGFN